MANQEFLAVTRSLQIAHSRFMEEPWEDKQGLIYKVCEEILPDHLVEPAWLEACECMSQAGDNWLEAIELSFSHKVQ